MSPLNLVDLEGPKLELAVALAIYSTGVVVIVINAKDVKARLSEHGVRADVFCELDADLYRCSPPPLFCVFAVCTGIHYDLGVFFFPDQGWTALCPFHLWEDCARRILRVMSDPGGEWAEPQIGFFLFSFLFPLWI
jgi:hypothetical protein